MNDWIAASACVAELGGAYPHIPNEPFLSEQILTAPPPLLRLGVDGEREMTFTDRLDESNYVIWDEHTSATGKMLDAHHTEVHVLPRAVTNPPLPPARILAEAPEPPTKVAPEPNSPLGVSRQ